MPGLRDLFGRRGRPAERAQAVARRPDPDQHVVRIADAPDRARVTLRGTVRALAVRPRSHGRWLEAVLADDSGTVTLIWMGRDAVLGVEEGREMRVNGRLSISGGQRRLYNPLYTLL